MKKQSRTPLSIFEIPYDLDGNHIEFIISSILTIIGLTKRNVLKRYLKVALFLDLLLLAFYIYLI